MQAPEPRFAGSSCATPRTIPKRDRAGRFADRIEPNTIEQTHGAVQLNPVPIDPARPAKAFVPPDQVHPASQKSAQDRHRRDDVRYNSPAHRLRFPACFVVSECLRGRKGPLSMSHGSHLPAVSESIRSSRAHGPVDEARVQGDLEENAVPFSRRVFLVGFYLTNAER